MAEVVLDISALTWPVDTGIPNYVRSLTDALAMDSPQWASVRCVSIGTGALQGIAPSFADRITTIPVPYRLGRHVARAWMRAGSLYHGLGQEMCAGIDPGRSVVTLYDAGPLLHRDQYPSVTHDRLSRLIGRLERVATRIVTISESVACDLVQVSRLPASRISVIYPGVDPDFQPMPGPPGPPYLLFAGAVQPRKNLKVLLQALAILRHESPFKDLRLCVLGSVGWNGASDLELVDELRLRDRVDMIGHVSRSEVPRYFAQAAAVVFPSVYEGFGLPIAEGMASGVPVVASDIPVVREVADGAAVVFPPNDAEALAFRVASILTDSQDRQRHIDRGLLVARRYDWHAAAASTFDLYRQILI